MGNIPGEGTCACIWRGVFRACFDCYEERVSSDYCADFVIVARRSLSPEDYRIFQRRFLNGESTKASKSRILRIEQKLGRIFCELKPHPLYPVGRYLSYRR